MSHSTRIAASFFILVASVFYIYQMVFFGTHAFEASWLLGKKTVGVATRTDLYRLGAICNSHKRTGCSLKVFAQLLENDPADVHAIGNMAMNLSIAEKYEKALPYFQLYFASSGNATDIAYSYAETHEKLGDKENAVKWYYNVLFQDARSEKAIQKLAHLLLELGNDFEAISACQQLESVNRAAKIAKTEIEEILLATSRETAEFTDRDESSIALRLPSLDGKSFLLPLITELGVQFVSVRDGVSGNQINSGDLVPLKSYVKKITDKKVLLTGIRVGQHLLDKLEVELCDSCETYLDTQALFHMGASIDMSGHVPFLIFK